MPRIEELILKKSILNPGLVAQAVGVAMMHLSTHPGPNLEKRRRLVYDWLGLWDLLLKGLEDDGGVYVKRDCVVQFEEAKERVRGFRELEKTSGVLLMATGEGTPGHRWAVGWMLRHVGVGFLGLEGEGYFLRHPGRRRPYFPLAIRASMWGWFDPRLRIFPIPPLNTETEAVFYDNMVGELGPDYSFASIADPNQAAKRARGLKGAKFTLISELASEHTASRVGQLIPFDLDQLTNRGATLESEHGWEM
jgi:hypothetical protein